VDCLAVVCPRKPNGRFQKRKDFKWDKGWAAFWRAVMAKLITARPCYANADAKQLLREANKFATQ
jgi:hypothetical protein